MIVGSSVYMYVFDVADDIDVSNLEVRDEKQRDNRSSWGED